MEIEFVGVSFTMHFCHDVLVVVVSQSTAQLVVVHVGLAENTPSSLFLLFRVV